MNEEEGHIIYCDRCGAEMNSNSRYCMKCGNLNYNHEANQNMRQFIPKNQQTTYQVSNSGKFMINDTSNSGVNVNSVVINNIASNTGSSTICFLVNFLIYILIIGFSFYTVVNGSSINIDLIAGSVFPYISIIVSLMFIYIYSLELVYMKCNKPWWAVLVPIYNMMVLSEIVFNKKWIGLVVFIPVIGQILLLVMFYKLGDSFKYSGLLVALFGIIFIPLMGFGTHLYQDKVFSDKNNSMEKNYKLKKVFLFFSMLFLLSGVGLFMYSNFASLEHGSKSIGNYYYVYASKRMASKVKNMADSDKLSCSGSEYSSTSGIYYVYYADVTDVVYLPFYYLRDEISGYVKIDNTSGSSKYYVSVSDGTYGFSDTLVDDITPDVVVNYSNLKDVDSRDDNVCMKKVGE